jgi:hypothetical protein
MVKTPSEIESRIILVVSIFNGVLLSFGDMSENPFLFNPDLNHIKGFFANIVYDFFKPTSQKCHGDKALVDNIIR